MATSRNNAVEDEIDAIRISIYEKTKNMTTAERVDYFNRRTREIAKKEGLDIKFAKAPGGTPTSRP